jgi:hypothetical protein
MTTGWPPRVVESTLQFGALVERAAKGTVSGGSSLHRMKDSFIRCREWQASGRSCPPRIPSGRLPDFTSITARQRRSTTSSCGRCAAPEATCGCSSPGYSPRESSFKRAGRQAGPCGCGLDHSDELSPGRLFIPGRLNDPMTGGLLYCRIRGVEGDLARLHQVELGSSLHPSWSGGQAAVG